MKVSENSRSDIFMPAEKMDPMKYQMEIKLGCVLKAVGRILSDI